MRRAFVRTVAVLFAVALAAGVCVTPAQAAPAHAPIEGTGSSWSANAVNQWIADVTPQGLRVVFSSTGSAQGRKDFAYRTTDFALSDIPFQNRDEQTDESDTSQGRPYVYLPIVAGGTAFPYQIKVGGQLVRNLRLSGRTLAEIFTNKITNWNDPKITADNNGRALPSKQIIPVLHSEGSGSTAQFTRYLATMFPDLWGPFNKNKNVMTEYFIRKDHARSANGSDGVMNFIASAAGDGAIGYDEYSYALNAQYPVAKIQNAAGYYTQPDQYNVAVGLTKAVIDRNPSSPTYLIQNLDNVYKDGDNRTYPLSSYSYMILPIGSTQQEDSRFYRDTAKRQTLVDFLYHSICLGQRKVGQIGYSPLPINLVQAGFEQIAKLKAADPGVELTDRDVKNCNNPTFIANSPERNYLAEIAPQPKVCDKQGAGPCGNVETRPTTPATNGSGGGGGSGAGGGTGGGAAAGGGGSVQVDPDTGEIIGEGSGQADGGGSGGGGSAIGVVSDLVSADQRGLTQVLGPLAIVELLALIVLPVLVARRLATGRRNRT